VCKAQQLTKEKTKNDVYNSVYLLTYKRNKTTQLVYLKNLNLLTKTKNYVWNSAYLLTFQQGVVQLVYLKKLNLLTKTKINV
jgi:hypothetical protein